MANPPPIVVIGASEGGVEALAALASGLPSDFGGAVFMVLHVGAHRSRLPLILSERGPLAARHPASGDPIHPGRIYVAPPDHHLVLEPGRLRLTRGPRENWARPAIDPLFRSAAAAYGSGVIGVILTGGLNDGTAGLYEIARHGGVTVVQDPADASNPSMPSSALKHVAVDHCLPLTAISLLLTELVASRRASAPTGQTQSASARKDGMTADYKLDRPVALTCPDCGGALRRKETGTLTQFACHIGHIYSAEVMAAAQFAAMEWSLEAAMRALSERAEMCREMAEKARKQDEPSSALLWDVAEKEARKRAISLRRILEEPWTQAGDPAPVQARLGG